MKIARILLIGLAVLTMICAFGTITPAAAGPIHVSIGAGYGGGYGSPGWRYYHHHDHVGISFHL